MGTKMGPSYANLFVGYIEHKFFNQYNGPKPELYRRHIDDCVGATSSTREELNQFITAFNSFHPPLKCTWEISDTCLEFLHIKLSIEGNGLCTSVHYKPTDSHSYSVLYSSSHPSHVKNPIPYSQFLHTRLRLGFSSLREYLYKISRCALPYCECGLDYESVKHFFLFCPRYAAQRNLLLTSAARILGETWSSSSDARKINFFLFGV